MSTPMLSSRVGSTSARIGPRRDPDSDDGAIPGPARDRESPTDLGRTASHRVQAEVAGMSFARVEAPPVVTDLYEDLPILCLHPHKRSGGVGVPYDIGKRLASNAVELSLHLLGECKTQSRSGNSYGR